MSEIQALAAVLKPGKLGHKPAKRIAKPLFEWVANLGFEARQNGNRSPTRRLSRGVWLGDQVDAEGLHDRKRGF